MMRVAIAADSLLQDLREALSECSDYHIVWVAYNGEKAVQNCVVKKPDLLLLDPGLRNIKGVEAVRRIMCETPCPILLVTETLEENAAQIFEAMGYGALDAVSVPHQKLAGQKAQTRLALLKKISTIKKLTQHTVDETRMRIPSPAGVVQTSVPPLIAIGSSAAAPKHLQLYFLICQSRFGALLLSCSMSIKCFQRDLSSG